ncbi:MAG TPA: helix-turn-helix domain-containing protein [Ktedonosporobacter sp.]|nr:helix-turn-helix domain-containing protein [Ktedonosporobacter sp.]
MTKPAVPLTTLSEEQREQAQSRFAIIRPALEDGVTQAQVARTQKIPASTIQQWVKRYHEEGLSGLADRPTRSDKGKSRRLPLDAIALIEGLALQPPPRSMAAIHRQVTEILPSVEAVFSRPLGRISQNANWYKNRHSLAQKNAS